MRGPLPLCVKPGHREATFKGLQARPAECNCNEKRSEIYEVLITFSGVPNTLLEQHSPLDLPLQS